MHEWFAQPIAAERMAAARNRATVHRLRVVGGDDLVSRLAAPFVALTDGGSTRLQRRRATAAAVVGPAC